MAPVLIAPALVQAPTLYRKSRPLQRLTAPPAFCRHTHLFSSVLYHQAVANSRIPRAPRTPPATCTGYSGPPREGADYPWLCRGGRRCSFPVACRAHSVVLLAIDSIQTVRQTRFRPSSGKRAKAGTRESEQGRARRSRSQNAEQGQQPRAGLAGSTRDGRERGLAYFQLFPAQSARSHWPAAAECNASLARRGVQMCLRCSRADAC